MTLVVLIRDRICLWRYEFMSVRTFLKTTAFALALRKAGVSAELYPDAAKFKKQMTYANRRNIPYVVLAGDQEMAAGTYALKNMQAGDQTELDLSGLITAVST